MSLYCEWDECVESGSHLGDCETRECSGCRPRLAYCGRLCTQHWSWVMRDLSRVPELVEAARSAVDGTRAPGDERVSGSGRLAPPAPLDTGAVDGVDELIAQLYSTAVHLAGEMHVLPPADIELWFSGSRVQGVRAGTGPEAAARAASQVVEWFRRHFETIATYPDVLDLGPELHKRVRVMSTRWPAAEPPRHVPGMPCPSCELADLWWTPPAGEGWPEGIECRACSYVAPAGDSSRMATLAAYRIRAARRAGV